MLEITSAADVGGPAGAVSAGIGDGEQYSELKIAERRGAEFAYLAEHLNAEYFPYHNPDIEQYQHEKHLEVITTTCGLDATSTANGVLPMPPALTSSEHLFRLWQYFFKPRLERIISRGNCNAAALFPGHIVSVFASDHNRKTGRHYRGLLFYEQYLDLLNFGGGLPSAIGGKAKQPRIAAMVRRNLDWPWRFINEPELSSVFPDTELDEVSSMDAEKYLRRVGKLIFSLTSEQTPWIEHALRLVHQLWTTAEPSYTLEALVVMEQVVSCIKSYIYQDTILPLMFELEAMASLLSYLGKLNVFASGMFFGNWIEVAAVSVTDCRGSELCNGERLFQELLKLPEHRFAPLVVNEYGIVSDGNHRLTAVWIWNLLHACRNCNWDLNDMQFQQRVADHFLEQQQVSGLHNVSIYEALGHLGEFLNDSHKRDVLQWQFASEVQRFKKIETVPVVLLPEYLSSAVIKDLYDDAGTRVRAQPHVYEFMAKEPRAVLPARGTYHFADCTPLPWFKALL